MSRFNLRKDNVHRERICLLVDVDLYRQLKALCVLSNVSVSTWFEDTVRAQVKNTDIKDAFSHVSHDAQPDPRPRKNPRVQRGSQHQ